MKQLFASALLLLAPAWVMAQGSGAATPAKPASAKQATAAKAKTFTLKGFEDVSAPRALRTDELPRIVADYRHAARLAIEAGIRTYIDGLPAADAQ